MAKVVANHLHELRQSRYLANALAVIIPESNLPLIALDLEQTMRGLKIPNILFMTEDRGNSNALDMPGSVTTVKKKREMVFIMINYYMKISKISFSENFLVSLLENTNLDNVQVEFIQQLRKFSQQRITTRNHRENVDEVHVVYNGKMCGANDDFVMALLIAVYHHRVFFKEEKYSAYWFGSRQF